MLFLEKLLVTFCIVSICAMFTGCSSPTYDPDNPDDYIEYWCNPAHRNGAIPPDQEWREKLEHNTDESYRQACMDQHMKRSK